MMADPVFDLQNSRFQRLKPEPKHASTLNAGVPNILSPLQLALVLTPTVHISGNICRQLLSTEKMGLYLKQGQLSVDTHDNRSTRLENSVSEFI